MRVTVADGVICDFDETLPLESYLVPPDYCGGERCLCVGMPMWTPCLGHDIFMKAVIDSIPMHRGFERGLYSNFKIAKIEEGSLEYDEAIDEAVRDCKIVGRNCYYIFDDSSYQPEDINILYNDIKNNGFVGQVLADVPQELIDFLTAYTDDPHNTDVELQF